MDAAKNQPYPIILPLMDGSVTVVPERGGDVLWFKSMDEYEKWKHPMIIIGNKFNKPIQCLNGHRMGVELWGEECPECFRDRCWGSLM